MLDEEIKLKEGLPADFRVENKVIFELKSRETVAPLDKKQVITYLHLTHKYLGFLINFNSDLIKNPSPALSTTYNTHP
ncbi:GxxExxY protein [Gloeothece verrucosa]|uniref:GxxExxY protein n=1 Tax=Gloeothece verrucosa TaxID=2546359 RepID=UPI0009FFC782